jgi:hypothetical protein
MDENIQTILEDIKNYLDITWEDPEGDKKLKGMILRGASAINEKSGVEFDYLQEGTHRSLLFHYVMYERSGMLNEFWINYKQDIIALQVKEEVRRFAENQQ